MRMKTLFPAVFFILVSANAYAQVSGGSTGGTTPGTTGTMPGTTGTTPGTTSTTPGTTGTIPGTTGTIPGTTGTTPGTTGTIPGTTETIPGTTGTIPGVAGTTPGTTGTIPGTTGTIPGTTGTIPGTTGTIPGTTSMPPATTPLPPATTGLPDFREDNTNMTGRLGGNTLDDGTLGDDTIVFDNRRGLDTLDDSAGLEGTQTGTLSGQQEGLFAAPDTSDTLDEGVFRDDRETPMDSATLSD